MFESAGFSVHSPAKWRLDDYDVFSDTGSVPFVEYVASENAIVHGGGGCDSKTMRTNFRIVSELFCKYPSAVFVLNTRPLRAWLISRYAHGLNRDGGRANWAWPPSEALTRKWVEDRRCYYGQIKQLFEHSRERLFVANIDKAGWQQELCTFFKLDSEKVDTNSQNVSRVSHEKTKIAQDVDRHLRGIQRDN